jgi:hypothetical protein
LTSPQAFDRQAFVILTFLPWYQAAALSGFEPVGAADAASPIIL